MVEVNKIFQKISKVMSLVSRVPKNGYNSFHKYHYATETDLTESIRPILQEAGLAFFSSVLEQERVGEFTKVKMEFTLADLETGEILKSTYWGEGQDKGDKGLYKAYTGATKYFLMKTFLIPTGDDPELDTPPPKNYNKPQNKGGQQQGQPPNNNNNNTQRNNNTQKMISDKQKPMLNGRLTELVKLYTNDGIEREEPVTTASLLTQLESMKDIGNFGSATSNMTAGQASKCINQLDKWIANKKPKES